MDATVGHSRASVDKTSVMPRMKQPDVDAFLAEPHVAVLATLRRDGRPYTVPVWFHWDGVAAWITGTYERVWCQQLFHDRRASLCIEASAPVAGHVGMDGAVTPVELPGKDIWPITSQLVDKYVRAPSGDAAADAFLANLKTEHRLLFRLDPDVLRAIDMRVYRGKRADREYQSGTAGERA
jgi:PPOX class probable F420-dependent enzyme